MLTAQGIGVFADIVIGQLVFYERQIFKVHKEQVEDITREMMRFREAKEQAVRQVHILHQTALREVSQENAAIFQAHHMLLEDMDFNGYVLDVIQNQHVNAEYAVNQAANTFCELFSSIEDPYLKQRAADIRDISQRLLTILTYGETKHFQPSQPSILVADELVPSEVMQIPRDKVLAIVMQFGAETSHSAIIIKDRNIPTILRVGMDVKKEYQGHLAAVDSYSGHLYIDPDEDTLNRLKEKKRREEEKRKGLSYLIGKESRTIDGRELDIFANITEPLDIEQVLRSDAAGIGLMRSEFLYLKRDDLPSEEEQINAYREVIRRMEGPEGPARITIIRTLDFGARKMIDLSRRHPDANPALGFRSIRICLAMPEMFCTQLRAIYRAACYGPVGIQFPMVDSVETLEEILGYVKQVKIQLKEEKKEFNPDVKIGLIIETPASVILSRELAKKVDFFHVDTNDLIQYSMAADRMSEKVSYLYQPLNPSILRLVKMTIDGAHKEGKWVGMCGEMAGDELAAPVLLGLGLDEFSMSASSILRTRKMIRSLSKQEMEVMAEKALQCGNIKEVTELVKNSLK